MEFIVPKITKSRTQKRRKRLIKNRRRNQRKKLEVKASKRRKITRDYNNISMLTQNANFSTTMTANSFWENYKIAHDWQHRHNVAWWKSRCIALEHENRALRDKIREQATTCNVNINNVQQTDKYLPDNRQNHYHTDKDEDKYDYDAVVDEENLEEDENNLEFHVDEEMMKFLEQSIRHKMELKRIRECEDDKLINEQKNSINIESGEAIVNRRINDAKLLYGAASSRILAMETAVQASIDQHKDRAKPHYWPNIPLKP